MGSTWLEPGFEFEFEYTYLFNKVFELVCVFNKLDSDCTRLAELTLS